MGEPRLKSRLMVQSLLRRCAVGGAFATVVVKGDDDAGAILIKINTLEKGCFVLTQCQTGEGEAAWIRGTGNEAVSETQADVYLERQRCYDPDAWVVEIEDREGRYFVDDPIL